MDRKEFQKNGAQHITDMIARAVADGSRTATVTGSWEIAESVRIPANFTLILQDCHLRMADGCYSNCPIRAV